MKVLKLTALHKLSMINNQNHPEDIHSKVI